MTNTSSKGTILFLDDDKFLLDMYSMKFAAAGYIVKPCLSVKEALEALRDQYNPDAILLDLIMPELDGFSFLETISKERLAPKALKVAFTNESSESEKARALDLGATLYIIKAQMIPSEVVNMISVELKKRHA